MGNINAKAWKGALDRPGITDFRWHGLRHTRASWYVQAGSRLHALRELGGWKSVDMVRRYAHLAPNHFAVYAECLSYPLVIEDTKLAPGKSSNEVKKR